MPGEKHCTDNVGKHYNRVFENADQEPSSGEAKRRNKNTNTLYITTDTNTLKKNTISIMSDHGHKLENTEQRRLSREV